MRGIKFASRYVADFETTVYEGQTRTDVWAAALTKIGDDSETVSVYGSIDEFMEEVQKKAKNENIIVYFHNLKFDGSFILNYLLTNEWHQSFYKNEKGEFRARKPKEMGNKCFNYSISDMGRWYTVTLKTAGHVVQFWDSLKLLPFSVKECGKAFKTKHQKLEMEYEGERYPNCIITPGELEYIKNDVLVVKEALEVMISQDHAKLTIGGCCLSEYKEIIKNTSGELADYTWDELFPDLTKIKAPKETCHDNWDEYIRKAYRGGWCYLVREKANLIIDNGTTADVNSLYPSVMHSDSGNYYPIGKPHHWIPQKGKIPDFLLDGDKGRFWFIRVKTRFQIREGFLPFIQIKGSNAYIGNECLTTSKIYDKKTKQYCDTYTHNGEVTEALPEMTMTMHEWELFNTHYELSDTVILDGCWFWAKKGIFDEYIDKWAEIKKNSTGAMRTLAKLFLNNLYGKMGASNESSFKIAYLDENGVLKFQTVEAHDKKPGYVPVGAAITAYARIFTITAAQKNFHGSDKPGFIYADTDSIHCNLPAEEIKGIKVHPTNFNCWKLESNWDKGIFVRQKTYIEHVTHEDLKPLEESYYNVKCAGMGKIAKGHFVDALNASDKEKKDELRERLLRTKLTKEEKEFCFHNMNVRAMKLTDFKEGLRVPGNLQPRQIAGGQLLESKYYTMWKR